MVDAINRTDMDLRKSLFGNIVLSGGATLTKGFGDRLLHEVQKIAVKDMHIKIFAPPEQKYSTWIGGSILAGLSAIRKVRCLASSLTFELKLMMGPRCGSTLTIGMKTQILSTPNLHKVDCPSGFSIPTFPSCPVREGLVNLGS